MPRNREFKFFKDDADETPIETTEQMSFKKAVKSIQNKVKDTKVIIEYIKVSLIFSLLYFIVNIPLG